MKRRYLGWWVPSSILFEPNILAHFSPWLTSASRALMVIYQLFMYYLTILKAGVLEECLFRAIPLSGAALIGDKFGKRNLFITIGFIIQAIVFSAAHADYPNQP
jgi:membrane protease YdiL (CAAX protease family)